MRRLSVIAAIAALPILLGGATCNERVHTSCTAALSAATTAEQLLPILTGLFQVDPIKAQQWAGWIFTGKITVVGLCAFIDQPSPVATP